MPTRSTNPPQNTPESNALLRTITTRPGVHTNLSELCLHLVTQLESVEKQIDMMRLVFNGAQPPFNEKYGLMREQPNPKYPWVQGRPRLVQYKWARGKRWRGEKINATHLALRAKSKAPFDKSYELMNAAFRVLDDLLNARSNLLNRYMKITALLDGVDEYEALVNELQVETDQLAIDARKIYLSDFEITARSLGYR